MNYGWRSRVGYATCDVGAQTVKVKRGGVHILSAVQFVDVDDELLHILDLQVQADQITRPEPFTIVAVRELDHHTLFQILDKGRVSECG